jgi:hypothetical protein
MIESATGDYVDPLPFFMEKVKDNIAPRAEGIILFPQPGKGGVKDLQYEQESWEVEITPEPGEYPVKAGQVIALSGNTGYSFGRLSAVVFQ